MGEDGNNQSKFRSTESRSTESDPIDLLLICKLLATLDPALDSSSNLYAGTGDDRLAANDDFVLMQRKVA